MFPELEKQKERFLKRHSDIGVNRAGEKQVLEFILQHRRILLGVQKGTNLAAQVDKETLKLMSAMDVDEPKLLAVEKMIKRLARGEGVKGLTLLETKLKEDAKAISQRQRELGHREKRNLDPLTKKIERRLKQKKNLTCREFIDELASNAPDSVVDEVDSVDGEVWLVGKSDSVTFGAIANRFTRAKKRLKF